MRLFRLGCVLATAGLLAGCGAKKADAPQAAKAKATATAAAPTPKPTPTPTPHAPPILSSAADLAACAQLEQVVTAVSALVGHTTEGITKALHPNQLAQDMATAQHSLHDSVNLVKLVPVTPALIPSQMRFEQGLRLFSADFGRAEKSAAGGDITTAAAQTVDDKALRDLQVSAKRIDDLCGG